jgi:hypothetical protein
VESKLNIFYGCIASYLKMVTIKKIYLKYKAELINMVNYFIIVEKGLFFYWIYEKFYSKNIKRYLNE